MLTLERARNWRKESAFSTRLSKSRNPRKGTCCCNMQIWRSQRSTSWRSRCSRRKRWFTPCRSPCPTISRCSQSTRNKTRDNFATCIKSSNVSGKSLKSTLTPTPKKSSTFMTSNRENSRTHLISFLQRKANLNKYLSTGRVSQKRPRARKSLSSTSSGGPAIP